MSITSFSRPSDADILRSLVDKEKVIGFVGKGSIHQNVNETLYVRTIKVKYNGDEVQRRVIFIKKGISWFFKKIENISIVKSTAM